MTDLTGRRVLVTGAAVRVGRTIALALADAGADVAVHYNTSEAAAAETVLEILTRGRRAAVVQGDLADPSTPERLIAAASEALGGLDAVVNNASIFEQGRLAEADDEAWNRMLRVNARAPLALGNALAAQLPEGASGDVIHLNDIHCLAPRAGYAPYTQSKALLHALTGDMALSLAPRVRVNAVALGAVLPPDAPPEGYEHTARGELPLGRFPKPDDVASAVIFLMGCSSVTGETIRVDGGQHLRGGDA